MKAETAESDLGRAVMELRAVCQRVDAQLTGYALTALVQLADGSLECLRFSYSKNRLALYGAEIEAMLLSAIKARSDIPIDGATG